MTISKTQPMRPAEIELVNVVNGFDSRIENVETEVASYDSRIAANSAAIALETRERESNVSSLQESINANTSAINTNTSAIAGLETNIMHIECGECKFDSIPTNTYADHQVTFTNQFDTIPVIVLTRQTNNEIIRDLDLAILDRSTLDFTMRIFNKGSSFGPRIGWIATTIGAHTS